jgi:hypothetical protein
MGRRDGAAKSGDWGRPRKTTASSSPSRGKQFGCDGPADIGELTLDIPNLSLGGINQQRNRSCR